MGIFSSDIYQAMYGPGDFSKIIVAQHKKFLSGDNSAIMTVLMACSVHQELIPDWVADELLTLDEKIADNQVHDMNEFFNFKPQHKGSLGKQRALREMRKKIYDELCRHRINDGDFTPGCGLQEVADKLGVGRRRVEEIYKENKKYFKESSKDKIKNDISMLGPLPSLLELAKLKRNQKD